METKIATESGHWYTKEGLPMYEVPNASKKGEMRATTLRDAKKLGLVPSVTMICGQLNKPALNQWLINQYLLSAFTCPESRDIGAEAWMKRVTEDAKEQSLKAREKGTEIHGVIEKGFQGQQVPDEYLTRYLKVLDILKDYGVDTLDIQAEKSFAGEGYGGKCDIFAGNVIADIKTTEFTCDKDGKPNKKLNWDEHILQLAGYAQGLCPEAILVNIYVSTISDDVSCFLWDEASVKKATEQFQLLVKLWWLKNGG